MQFLSRRIPRILLGAVLAALTLAGIAAAGMTITMRGTPPPASAGAQEWPTPRASSDGPIAVAVVLGRSGTVGSDVLAPYEVFASSPTFSVYTVAESAAPAPIGGGPAVLPTHTFADIESGVAPTPDVVVVPAVADPTGEQEATLRAWVRRHHDRGAHIFGVCAGSRVLAATGLLDGHRATSHWGTIGSLEKDHPEVQWVRGRRYVQDGSITTTAGITSGLPGALKLVQDLAGPAEAQRIGRSLNYPGWSLHASSSIPEQHFASSDVPFALARGLPWLRPTVGIGLTDGLGEIDVAAAFEVYEVSAAARAVPIATRSAVTTRHGVVLFATPIDTVGTGVDRLVVPGTAHLGAIDPPLREWAAERQLDVEPLQRSDDERAFDAALRHLAEHTDRATALSTAKFIDYPSDHLQLTDDGRTWRVPALLFLSVLLAAGVGFLPAAATKAVRRRRVAEEAVRGDPSRDVSVTRSANATGASAARIR